MAAGKPTIYRDFAQEDAPFVTKEPFANLRGEKCFLDNLHRLLYQLEAEGLSQLAHWAIHGRCFFVVDREKFVEKALGRWFQQTKFSSFQRQLNHYGFTRITTGRDKGGFYHELFLRGKSALAARIPRVQIKGPKRLPAAAETDPDFYQMTHLPVINARLGENDPQVLAHEMKRCGKVQKGIVRPGLVPRQTLAMSHWPQYRADGLLADGSLEVSMEAQPLFVYIPLANPSVSLPLFDPYEATVFAALLGLPTLECTDLVPLTHVPSRNHFVPINFMGEN